ncbi:MAG: SGNH/GDSL hydrolase family protein [Verrucomicrobiia bacterium]
MKKVVRFIAVFLLFGTASLPVQAAFTSLYIFGDGLSTTTNNPSTGPYYYGQRYCNGRVWVEVLAQRQGLTYNSNQNWSYFGNTSTSMVATVSSLQAPTDASNALFVIWVNNADLFYPALNNGTSMSAWTNAINVSLTNHFKAITNLYAKGASTLIMPNAVDLSTIPEFNTSLNTNFIHQMCTNYNVAFAATLDRARTNCPGLTIYTPDFFTLLTNILAYPASYNVTNALYNGHSVDVIDAPSLSDKTTNGPGTNYIFWDGHDPTAMVHAWMANLAQQLISPAQIGDIALGDGSNELDLVNVPIGQNGIVLGSASLAQPGWQTNATFISSNATQSVFVPPSGPLGFYRLSFPFSWTWP